MMVRKPTNKKWWPRTSRVYINKFNKFQQTFTKVLHLLGYPWLSPFPEIVTKCYQQPKGSQPRPSFKPLLLGKGGQPQPDPFLVLQMSHEKNPLTFHYTACLIGILIMVHYNALYNWIGFHPLYQTTNQGPFFHCSNNMFFISYFSWMTPNWTHRGDDVSYPVIWGVFHKP